MSGTPTWMALFTPVMLPVLVTVSWSLSISSHMLVRVSDTEKVPTS